MHLEYYSLEPLIQIQKKVCNENYSTLLLQAILELLDPRIIKYLNSDEIFTNGNKYQRNTQHMDVETLCNKWLLKRVNFLFESNQILVSNRKRYNKTINRNDTLLPWVAL